ncbi:MAG: glycerol-3-phosphate 1-O-acyltransferase PlsY [Candidatus Omnitrophota bacterium]|nr:glycerol-3-phosphate 1-O-acyltransferase PlsY [Candidatus Omnitrophota bacterium]
MLNIVLGTAAAYLIGSFPTSYLIGKLKGIDVSKQGSGNTGATNVLRVMGKLPAIITLIADIAKGAIAVIIVAALFYNPEMPVNRGIFRALLGLSSVAGHNWSIFLKFRGGKGVAASCGVFMVLLPGEMAVAAVVFLLAVLLTKYISIGSLLLALTVPVCAALTGESIELVILAITVCIIVSYRHKSNIKRLLAGTENKIGGK